MCEIRCPICLFDYLSGFQVQCNSEEPNQTILQSQRICSESFALPKTVLGHYQDIFEADHYSLFIIHGRPECILNIWSLFMRTLPGDINLLQEVLEITATSNNNKAARAHEQ